MAKTRDDKANRDLILKAIRFTMPMYNGMMINTALAWIERHFGSDARGVELISECPMFWVWWRNQWQIRDAQFIYETSLKRMPFPLSGTEMIILIDLYHNIHDLGSFTIQPNRQVMTEINKAFKAELERLFYTGEPQKPTNDDNAK